MGARIDHDREKLRKKLLERWKKAGADPSAHPRYFEYMLNEWHAALSEGRRKALVRVTLPKFKKPTPAEMAAKFIAYRATRARKCSE